MFVSENITHSIQVGWFTPGILSTSRPLRAVLLRIKLWLVTLAKWFTVTGIILQKNDWINVYQWEIFIFATGFNTVYPGIIFINEKDVWIYFPQGIDREYKLLQRSRSIKHELQISSLLYTPFGVFTVNVEKVAVGTITGGNMVSQTRTYWVLEWKNYETFFKKLDAVPKTLMIMIHYWLLFRKSIRVVILVGFFSHLSTMPLPNVTCAGYAVNRAVLWREDFHQTSPVQWLPDNSWKWLRRKGCLKLLMFLFLLSWVFPKIGIPQNGWFIMEIPIKMDETPSCPVLSSAILRFLCFFN